MKRLAISLYKLIKDGTFVWKQVHASVQNPPPSFPNYRHQVRWNERYHSK
jgi:hypothetical protein